MAELDATVATEATETEETQDQEATDINAELAQLKAELAKNKAALDKATKEAGDYRKQLRSKQTADEIAAEEKRVADEERDKELNDLRKRFAVMETSKSILARVGGDEAAASKIAEYMYGAADADGALTEIQKIITAREKALRLEFGKIPAPSAGNADGPIITKAQLDAMGLKDRVGFKREHPEEYDRLMGR